MQTQASDELLTFEWLYRKVQGYSAHSIYATRSRLETWSFRIGLGAGVSGILLGQLPASAVRPSTLLWWVVACLCVEVAGILLGVVLMLRRELRQYTRPRLSHVQEMDADFLYWRSIIGRLRMFPRIDREERLRFVGRLRAGMIDRMGLMYGSLQHLGPFPLLVALYLQFRNVGRGGLVSVLDISAVEALLIFALLLLYLGGWVLVGLRVRLDIYIGLLEASLHEDSTAPTAPTAPTADHH